MKIKIQKVTIANNQILLIDINHIIKRLKIKTRMEDLFYLVKISIK